MNLAFGALLIFILLFPGFSFRSAYLGGPYALHPQSLGDIVH